MRVDRGGAARPLPRRSGAAGAPLAVLPVVRTPSPPPPPLDRSWRCATEAPFDWTMPDAAEAGWVMAREFAPFGAPPWGRVGVGRLTLSPVTADPFDGDVTIPADLDRARVRLCLACDDPIPEAACCVDGRYAGGCFGPPFRIDLTDVLTPGAHHVRISPFARARARRSVAVLRVVGPPRRSRRSDWARLVDPRPDVAAPDTSCPFGANRDPGCRTSGTPRTVRCGR